jgi:pimeloyl-ACP methyl ester carboxylesterase
MLREGKQNSANIAYSVGFNSEAAFNRAFKREFGEPPVTWRRRTELEERSRSLPQAAAPADEIAFCTSADGTTIAYAVSGEGFPLVKAPNCVTHLEHDRLSPIYSHWVAELSRSTRLVRFDMRGFGMSQWNPEEFSLDAHVDDLAAVIDSSGVDQCDLLGITHGAAIAIAYAARNPERVRKLVLLNSFAAGWAVRADPEELAWRKSLMELNRKRWAREGVALGERFVSLYFPSGAADIIDWHRQLFDELCTADSIDRMLEWGSRIDVRNELTNVRAPTIVFHAIHDGNAPPEVGRQVADGIRDARLVELDSANHVLLESEPAWPVLVREMQGFLAAETMPPQPAPIPVPA